VNTIWDPEILLALCDPQDSNYFTAQDVQAIFRQLLLRRTPNALSGGGPGPDDRPFRGLASGYSTGDAQNPSPRGLGIDDTLLCPFDGGKRRLFQVPAANVPDRHPYLQNELLTKIFNHLTTRSNVFAVWLTVGFFEVTDDSVRPVKLGAEVGRAEGHQV